MCYDLGILSHNNNIYWTGADNRVTIQITDTGTILNSTGTGLYNYYLKMPSSEEVYCYPQEFNVEFDIVDVSISNGTRIQVYDGTDVSNFNFNELGVTGNNHVKIIVKDGYVKYYVDDAVTPVRQSQVTFNSLSRVGFRGQNYSTIKFKNFIIYTE